LVCLFIYLFSLLAYYINVYPNQPTAKMRSGIAAMNDKRYIYVRQNKVPVFGKYIQMKELCITTFPAPYFPSSNWQIISAKFFFVFLFMVKPSFVF